MLLIEVLSNEEGTSVTEDARYSAGSAAAAAPGASPAALPSRAVKTVPRPYSVPPGTGSVAPGGGPWTDPGPGEVLARPQRTSTSLRLRPAPACCACCFSGFKISRFCSASTACRCQCGCQTCWCESKTTGMHACDLPSCVGTWFCKQPVMLASSGLAFCPQVPGLPGRTRWRAPARSARSTSLGRAAAASLASACRRRARRSRSRTSWRTRPPRQRQRRHAAMRCLIRRRPRTASQGR